MPVLLYDDGIHKCIAYSDLIHESGIQANQFLITHNGRGALLDPGGDLAYEELLTQVSSEVDLAQLDYVLASHQDPDIIASLGRWMNTAQGKLVIPKLWERFIPHVCRPTRSIKMESRIIPVPDEGAVLRLGDAPLVALPAHFLHSEGNLQFYDPVSRILFSGDLGASIVDSDPGETVTDFDAHIPFMIGFHQRYISCNKICRYWANMVRELDIEWIVPQHGRSFKGKEMVSRFIDWIESTECGTDLFTQDNYRLPARKDVWI